MFSQQKSYCQTGKCLETLLYGSNWLSTTYESLLWSLGKFNFHHVTGQHCYCLPFNAFKLRGAYCYFCVTLPWLWPSSSEFSAGFWWKARVTLTVLQLPQDLNISSSS